MPEVAEVEGLNPLDLAVGQLLEPTLQLPVPPGSVGPRDVLEAQLAGLMSDAQVFVSFSGGRDSSLLLAVAQHVARRDGLPAPVPVTLRHEGAESRESDWQEDVVRHLGLREWIKVEAGDDLDLLGPRALGILESVGVTSPPNTYLHLPMFEQAAGGVLVTGAGGDELLGYRASHLVRRRWGDRTASRRRAAQSAVFAAAPRSVRRAWKRRSVVVPAWLTTAARREATRLLADDEARPSWRWDEEVVGWAASRTASVGRAALDAVAAAAGSRTASPLMSEEFAAALARSVGPAGPKSRTHAMWTLASDLLPDAVLSRPTKAAFGDVIWGPEFRRFVAQQPRPRLRESVRLLVDEDALHAAWSTASPPYTSMMLLHDLWLANQPST